MSAGTPIDPKAFRNALGQFATGVTIITTVAENGAYVGLTANSFSSVSIDPPLVLWSLDKSANSMPVFLHSDVFAIHVLTAGQMDLSNRFASKREDKFDGMEMEAGIQGMPLLTEYAARFQCRKVYEYEGGDHIIFVGEVVDFEQSGEEPLLFHGGQYARSQPHPATQSPARSGDATEGSFTEDFLMYLLERATPQVTLPFHRATEAAGLSLFAMRALALLSIGDRRHRDTIKALNPLETCDMDRELDGLIDKGLIQQANDHLALTEAGRRQIVELLAAGKAAEADALQDLSPYEQRLFKDCLKRIIARTALDMPDPFAP